MESTPPPLLPLPPPRLPFPPPLPETKMKVEWDLLPEEAYVKEKLMKLLLVVVEATRRVIIAKLR